VADPWTEDFTALGTASRSQLRPMAATRAHVLSHQETSKMRFFTNRPVLALLLVLAFVGVASGAAYAVNRVFLSVDPDMTAPEIEQDVQAQLDQAGIKGTVHADKSDDKIQIAIKSDDERLGSDLDVDVDVPNAGVITDRQGAGVRMELATVLTDAQQKQLMDAITGKVFTDLIIADKMADHHDTAALATALARELASHGFKDVAIDIQPTATTVRVNAPPVE